MIQGREAIAAMWREDQAGGPTETRFESIDILESGGLVVDVGRYVSPSGRGKYVVVLERQPDRSLKIAVDAPSGDAPPAPTS